MQKRWLIHPANHEQAQSIANAHGISPLIAQMLLNRGVSETEEITHFLKPSLAHLPDPNLLKDMEQAVARLIQAIKNKEPITIYGDYDVDGTTATALLMDFFQSLNTPVDYYIPHRLKEGYSLNSDALKTIANRGTKVLITVDNGISAVGEAEVAAKLGLDLIITDHHEVPPILPKAIAILNPKQVGDDFPGKQLAGVGVAFYLLIALRRSLREAGVLSDQEPNLRRGLDLVAVGTIADLAPLTGINRHLVAEGLKVLSQTTRKGLRALLNVSGIDGPVRSDQVAFQLGPRINAVGRLEDASTGVQLLLCQEMQQARRLAEQLDTANQSRKSLEDQIAQSAYAQIETQGLTQKHRSLVLYDSNWHPGVIGIVASRLVERYHRPAIVLTQDQEGIKGSARSIHGFNMVEGLRNCQKLLRKFGGHAYAAGLSLPKENLARFIEEFDQVVRHQLKEDDFLPVLNIDSESHLEWIDPALLQQLKRLEPHGLGNPSPLFCLKSTQVKESRIVGERHLRLKVGNADKVLTAIGFRLAEKQPALQSNVDLAFVPEWNEWNGTQSIQLRFKDIRPTTHNNLIKN